MVLGEMSDFGLRFVCFEMYKVESCDISIVEAIPCRVYHDFVLNHTVSNQGRIQEGSTKTNRGR